MENISLVLWLSIYPVSFALTSYLNAKEKKVNGERPQSKESELFNYFVNMVLWVVVALVLKN